MTVDPKVFELAALFLADHFEPNEQRTLALAESIQFSIEEWIADEAGRGAPDFTTGQPA